MDYKQLSEKYINCLKRYYEYIYNDYAETNLSEVANLEKDILNVENEIYRLNILSKNEEIDDINTCDLKYMLFPFIKAESLRVLKSYQTSSDHFKRESDIEELKSLYLNFLNDILIINNSIPKELLELIGDSKITNYITENSMKEVKESRNSKIMRFRKIKELKTKLDQFFKSGFYIPDESDNRIMYLEVIKLFFLEAIEQILMIDNELQVLKYFTKNHNVVNESKLESDRKTNNINLSQKLNIHHISPNIRYLTTKDQNNSSFTIKDIKNNSVFDLRERFYSKVFGPSHILPTISIAEAADIELSQAREYEKTADDIRKAKEEREKILNDKEYSREEEEDEYKTRLWDDWKDYNPKGHGNTIKNMG